MFRLSARADPAFLTEMLYEAVYWLDDGAEERPPLDALLDDPRAARYVAGWGRTDDACLCALDRTEEPVGAAWYRFFTEAEPGYGYVADDIPELVIAVYPEFRGRRVGSLLLGGLIARAARAGARAVSLSVHPDNPAKRLFVRNGFEVVATHDGALTMLVEIN